MYSEANHVILLWNDFVSNKAEKHDEKYETKLIYTAITRATKKVDLIVPT